MNCARFCAHSNKKKHLRAFRKCLKLWCRGTESNCRNGGFQTKFSKIQKCCNFKLLVLFKFIIVFLVSFGTVWKCLTLTGTIWAQSNKGTKGVTEKCISLISLIDMHKIITVIPAFVDHLGGLLLGFNPRGIYIQPTAFDPVIHEPTL